MKTSQSLIGYAREALSECNVGDVRRTRALTQVLAGLLRRPGGKITEVFRSSKLRQQTYKILSNTAVQATALLAAVSAFCGRLASKERRAPFLILDGSSLNFVDRHSGKDFGHIGTYFSDARGLKVITGYVLAASGTPIGIGWQTFWARMKRKVSGSKSADVHRRGTHQKETRFWLETLQRAAHHLMLGGSRKPWVLIDREGDSRPMLEALADGGFDFTLRSSADRVLSHEKNGRKGMLRSQMRRAPLLGKCDVQIPRTGERPGREVTLSIRSKAVKLVLRERWSKRLTRIMRVNVVWATELNPRRKEPLDWMLFTTAPVETIDNCLEVIESYKLRWRIEDFHKTWKSSHCRTEDSQLHSRHAATTFAILQATVAARIETLKHLHRKTPDLPAPDVFSFEERCAIQVLAIELLEEPIAPSGRRQTRLKVPAPEKMTVGEAIDWIARFGGYTGKSSGGPPGAQVLSRGLLRVLELAAVIPALEKAFLKRRGFAK